MKPASGTEFGQDPLLKVRFYGRLADLFGKEREVAAPLPRTIAELRLRLAADRPDAADAIGRDRARAALNDRFVGDDHPLAPGTTVDLLAPVSGG